MKINRCINEYRHDKVLIGELQKEIALTDSALRLSKGISERKDSLVLLYQKKYEISDNNYKNLTEDCRRKLRRSVIYVILSGIAGLVLGHFVLN